MRHLNELLLGLDVLVEAISLHRLGAGVVEAYYGIRRVGRAQSRLGVLQWLLSLFQVVMRRPPFRPASPLITPPCPWAP